MYEIVFLLLFYVLSWVLLEESSLFLITPKIKTYVISYHNHYICLELPKDTTILDIKGIFRAYQDHKCHMHVVLYIWSYSHQLCICSTLLKKMLDYQGYKLNFDKSEPSYHLINYHCCLLNLFPFSTT